MASPPLDAIPGYRRRFIVTPQPGLVRSELEDDFHHMGVEVRHEDGIAVAVDAITVRAPWNTCPGAITQVRKTFLGVAQVLAFAWSINKKVDKE